MELECRMALPGLAGTTARLAHKAFRPAGPWGTEGIPGAVREEPDKSGTCTSRFGTRLAGRGTVDDIAEFMVAGPALGEARRRFRAQRDRAPTGCPTLSARSATTRPEGAGEAVWELGGQSTVRELGSANV